MFAAASRDQAAVYARQWPWPTQRLSSALSSPSSPTPTPAAPLRAPGPVERFWPRSHSTRRHATHATHARHATQRTPRTHTRAHALAHPQAFELPDAVDAAVAAVFGLHGLPLPPRQALKGGEKQPAKVTPAVLAKTYSISGAPKPSGSAKNHQVRTGSSTGSAIG